MAREPHVTEFERRVAQIVLSSGVHELADLVVAIDRLIAAMPLPANGGLALYSQPEHGALVAAVAAHFGVASTLLFNDGNGQNAVETRARKRRVAQIVELLRDIDISPLRDRTLRNRIVHLDEHWYRTLRAAPSAAIIGRLGMSHRRAFTSEKVDGVLVYDRLRGG